MAAPLETEYLQELVNTYRLHKKNKQATADAMGLSRETVRDQLKTAARRGLMLDDGPAMPGFRVNKRSTNLDKNGEIKSQTVREEVDPGESETVKEFREKYGLDLMSKATLHVKDGNVVQSWPRVAPDADRIMATRKAMLDGFKDEIPRAAPILPAAVAPANANLINQYTVTDLHFGMLAWAEENKKRGWDLKKAEATLVAWFREAITRAPWSAEAIFAQIGDMMHHDALKAVTPAHGHVLDADSRLQKVIRVVIRVIRQIIGMLLEKYPRVTVIMASGNHDEASGIWLREGLAAMYEHEPRVVIDTGASLYFAKRWGKVGLYYHHGHKRGPGKGLDSVLASMYREIFGSCVHNYAHCGHFHHLEVKETALMIIEQHRTLAAADSHASGGGWISGSSADVITYHKEHGQVGRVTLTPEMVLAA